MQSPLAHHRRPAPAGIGLEQLIGQADAPAEVQSPRHVGDEIVGAEFEQELILPHGMQDAAQAIAGLEQPHLARRIELDQPMRRGQTGDAATDHGHTPRAGRWVVAVHALRRAPNSFTASTSATTFSTGVCCRTPCPRLKMCPGRPAA